MSQSRGINYFKHKSDFSCKYSFDIISYLTLISLMNNLIS